MCNRRKCTRSCHRSNQRTFDTAPTAARTSEGCRHTAKRHQRHCRPGRVARTANTQRFVRDSLKLRTARFEHAHRRFAELSHIDHGIKLCPLFVDRGDRVRSGVQKCSKTVCTDIQWESSSRNGTTQLGDLPGGFRIGASTSEMAVLGHIRPRFSTVMYRCILGSPRGRSERTLGSCVL